jgi:hypothetical protein
VPVPIPVMKAQLVRRDRLVYGVIGHALRLSVYARFDALRTV